ncbi:MAG: hypothetical protein LUE10_07975 [Alistipes sp.]|nr:hypothetical protein [Alistipes sp.]
MYSKLTAEYHHIHELRRGGNDLKKPPHEALIAEQLNHLIDGGGLKFDWFTPTTATGWAFTPPPRKLRARAISEPT